MVAEKPKAEGRGRRSKTDTGNVPDGVIVIKKYANRRLYNTASSSYVTLDHLCQMIKVGIEFIVFDAKTNDDITRSVLTQIIVEEEGKGQNMLPISFLRQLIGFYGDSLQMVVPGYLDQAMSTFSQNQDRTRDYMQEALGGLFPLNQFEDVSKQNMAMFEQAMRFFTPPTGAGAKASSAAYSGGTPGAGSTSAEPSPPSEPSNDAIDALKSQVDLLQKQLNELSKKA